MLSFQARSYRNHRHHRPERRGQDDGVQLPDRLLPPDVGRDAPLRANAARSFGSSAWRPIAIARDARVVRTFQNVASSPGMSVLENLIVAQHADIVMEDRQLRGRAARLFALSAGR